MHNIQVPVDVQGEAVLSILSWEKRRESDDFKYTNVTVVAMYSGGLIGKGVEGYIRKIEIRYMAGALIFLFLIFYFLYFFYYLLSLRGCGDTFLYFVERIWNYMFTYPKLNKFYIFLK